MDRSNDIGIMSKEYLMSLILPWKLMMSIQLHIAKCSVAKFISVGFSDLGWRNFEIVFETLAKAPKENM